MRPDQPDDESDGEPTTVLPAGKRCRGGHDQPRNPAFHATLGLVPALSSVILGIVVVIALLGLAAWLLPSAVGWLLALLGIGLLFSAATQFWLGHRGACLVWRTLRWWLGPIGSLVDPIEMG